MLSALWILAVLTVSLRDRPIAGWSLVRDQQTQADPLDALIDSLPDAKGSAPIYWTQRGSIMVLPPVLGYATLFLVVPWIVKGFKNE